MEEKESVGVLIASDAALEWLVPYWYFTYKLQNQYPVAIVDLGMSDQMVSWCKERMIYRKLEKLSFSIEKDAVSDELKKIWAGCVKGDLFEVRKQWFKKPAALLLTPFKRTLWLDVDCEVRASLSPVFAIENAVAAPFVNPLAEETLLETGAVPKDQKNYSSGMVLYDADAELITLFKEASEKENHKFLGDQDLFSYLIHKHGVDVGEITPKMHCEIRCGADPTALVWHYTGDQKSILFEKWEKLKKSPFLTNEF